MLDGVRILDLSRLLPGPAATSFLQGMGAQVDRVEPPGAGDFARHIPPFVDGVGAYYAAVSRGKRSVALPTRTTEGKAAIRDLIAHYDVVVEGFKPGVMEAMGLDPAALVEKHPGLIVARLSGFGQTGAYRSRPGHDINYIGLTGLISAGEGGRAFPPVQVADLSGALVAAAGVCAALFQRERTGSGQVIDVSLAESALFFMAPMVAAHSASKTTPKPGGEVLSGGLPIYGCYECSDGKFLTLGALEPKFQAELARHGADPSKESALSEFFAQRTRDEWVELLSNACVGPVLSVNELAEFGPFSERGAVTRTVHATWVNPPLSSPDLATGRVPELGEHTTEVLVEAGFDPERIASLS